MASGSRSQQRSTNDGATVNQRYSNLIYDSEVFLTKLREFKTQSLGCSDARRKSSSTLIFPNPPQACVGPPKCPKYPHNVLPTSNYWIECHGPGPLSGNGACKTLTPALDSSLSYTAATTSIKGIPEASQKGSSQMLPALTIASSGAVAKISTGADRKPDNELRLVVDCPSRSSGSSAVSMMPTTPTAERILTRHDKDFLSSQDQIDQIKRDHNSRFWRQQADDQRVSDNQQQVDWSNNKPIDVVEASLDSIGQQRPQDSMDDIAMAKRQLKNTQHMRKQFNKRTMTRDDIDLHKPRRGTPNITITEPSFNQSVVTYAPLGRTRTLDRQGSQIKGDLAHLDGEDVAQNQTNASRSDSRSDGSFTTSFAQQTRPDSAESCNRASDLRYYSNDSSLHDRPTSGSDVESISTTSQPPQQRNDMLDFKPYRAHHRPSIIREDSDAERGEGANLNVDRELVCGLSTTTFQKMPYQQARQQRPEDDQVGDNGLELISFEEENYEKHYYGREHWNYFTNDECLGPVMLSLKQEVNNQRDHFHVLLRTVSYTLHGTIPASTICADRYDREAIVRELSEIAKLKPPLMLGQLPSTPDELLKLDHIFIKTELKVGVIYIKENQAESEEAILSNKEESPLFKEFLDILGDRITLKGFDRYKGGLDTVHNLTGTESVYTLWRNIEIMFHVSTMLPHEENDPQKLQKKRHIGNDIVCVAFIESDDTLFWPGCIKSYFIHTFITVRTSPKPLKEGEKRKYSVSCVCRNEVQYAFKPYLVEQDEFLKSDYFREWLLVKIVNGERASYSAPKFARMQDRTRCQLLEDIITNLANHLVTGQIPKPYRRGSWRPLGHTRASSPLEDSMKDYFEDYETLAKDFSNAFCGQSRSMLCDVVFRVKDKDGTSRLVHGVRAIMAIRSRNFLEMLYGFVPPGAGSTSLQNQTNLRAIEMKALAGESSSGGKELEHTKSLLTKRGSVGADSSKKYGEKERRQSMLPNLSKSISQKPNYLTVPSTSGGGGGGGSSGGPGGVLKNAFNRLIPTAWSGWSGTVKSYKGEPMHIKVDQNKTKVDLNSLAICKEIAKIDADKLAQKEFEIKEFDYETFQQTIEYIHNGQCKLSYETIPDLICAAEHYDLPDLLHACFHHANTHMKLSAAPKMMNALYQSSCFYVTAMQLLDAIYDYIDAHGTDFLSRTEYLELNESVFSTLLSRKTFQASELKKFQAMDIWVKHQLAMKNQMKHQLTQQSSDADKRIDLVVSKEESDAEYRNLMIRLNREISIKLDKMSNEDLVKVILPTRVFNNEKVFNIMSDESRLD